MTLWIGIDPGSRFTGAILRDGRKCLGWRVTERERDETEILVGPAYWDEVGDSVEFLARVALKCGSVPQVAIEGVRPPQSYSRGKKALTPPIHLMGLAATWAWLMCAYPGAVLVAPEGNGSGLLGSYPEELVTVRERRLGLGRQAGDSAPVSHARSAWDVSLIGERMRGAA